MGPTITISKESIQDAFQAALMYFSQLDTDDEIAWVAIALGLILLVTGLLLL